MPPAFNLSQDQTLQFNPSQSLCDCCDRYSSGFPRPRRTTTHSKSLQGFEACLTWCELGLLLRWLPALPCGIALATGVTQRPHLSAVQFLKSMRLRALVPETSLLSTASAASSRAKHYKDYFTSCKALIAFFLAA